jgi:hypothetical protein
MSVAEKKGFWDKAQSLDRRVLYAVLIVFTAVSLFFKSEIPVNPDDSSKELYVTLMTIDPSKTVLIESDWTNSTRGESAGHFEALLRILMVRDIKFVIYSVADPQAPQVARDTMRRINQEREDQGLKVYEPWTDYLDIGYFPNAEGHLQAIANNIRTAWGGRKERDTTGTERNIFESPVLANVRSVSDSSLLVVCSASATIDYAVERLYGKVPLGFMVTGVMGPNALPYFQARQIVGMGVGLKGVYDVEYMMQYGVNYRPDGAARAKVEYKTDDQLVIEPVTEGTTFGRGARYFLPLHVALGLMILAIILGNLGMVFTKKRKVTE